MSKIKIIAGTVLSLLLAAGAAYDPMVFRFVVTLFMAWLVTNSETMEMLVSRLLEGYIAINFNPGAQKSGGNNIGTSAKNNGDKKKQPIGFKLDEIMD